MRTNSEILNSVYEHLLHARYYDPVIGFFVPPEKERKVIAKAIESMAVLWD